MLERGIRVPSQNGPRCWSRKGCKEIHPTDTEMDGHDGQSTFDAGCNICNHLQEQVQSCAFGRDLAEDGLPVQSPVQNGKSHLSKRLKDERRESNKKATRKQQESNLCDLVTRITHGTRLKETSLSPWR